MKVLITGGCGFIGSNIASAYMRRGDKILIVDDLSRKGSRLNLKWLKSSGPIDFIKQDIADYKSLRKTIEKNKDVDAIFHMAAQVAVTGSVENPRRDFEINAFGTFNLLEAVRSASINPVIIYASTNKVYGEMEDLGVVEKNGKYAWKDMEGGISEGRPLDFHSPYGCSKGCAEQYVHDYSRIYGLRTVVMRQSCIYGPRQFGVEDQGWVAHFIISAILGRKIIIYGDGKQVRDILYIDDLTDVFHLAHHNIDKVKGAIFNIGGGCENTMSLLELITILKEELNKDIPVGYESWRPGDQKVYVSDVSKAEETLGWKPKIHMSSGIKKLISWVKENKELFIKALDRK
ncbi:MAG: SDR family NAD(P)-dependent oxidoreductase [Candidatus Omnitrophica bacterium]|nr:SDR family NAD(P)-dependent oxidoreductase [Candidatus Omnitrophota bacterium]